MPNDARSEKEPEARPARSTNETATNAAMYVTCVKSNQPVTRFSIRVQKRLTC